MKAAIPADEVERLQALSAHEILDTEHETVFDAIAQYAADICGAREAYISLIDDERQWFKAAVGSDAKETPREVSFCAHAILEQAPTVVPDARLDGRFADNPNVTSGRIRFYAGVPLATREGFKLGTLCVADSEARELTEAQLEALVNLARHCEIQLALRRRLLELERLSAALDGARRGLESDAGRRRQLAAMLVHDLKSPVTVVMVNSRFLLSDGLAGEQREAAHDILSAAQDMQVMTMNLLDIFCAELGGLHASVQPQRVDAVVERALSEARRLAGERQLNLGAAVEVERPVEIDAHLIGRVLQNLIDNALRHTPAGGKVHIAVTDSPKGGIRIAVSDDGPGIPQEVRERIFDQFFQTTEGAGPRTRANRGLGLAFTRLAVNAHGGEIWVEDDSPRGARFVFDLPRA